MNDITSTSNMSFDDVFARMGDSDLSSCVVSAVESSYGYENIMNWANSIPLECRTAGYVYLMTGFLENGGYARLFELECNHAAYPECLDILGFHDLAEVLRRSFEIVRQDLRGDEEALTDRFGTWENLESLLNDTESSLFAASHSIYAAHARYLRQHKSSFEHLFP